VRVPPTRFKNVFRQTPGYAWRRVTRRRKEGQTNPESILRRPEDHELGHLRPRPDPGAPPARNAINIEFERPITPEQVREISSIAPGVRVVDAAWRRNHSPMPLEAERPGRRAGLRDIARDISRATAAVGSNGGEWRRRSQGPPRPNAGQMRRSDLNRR